MNFSKVPDCSILKFRCPCSLRHLPRKAQHGVGVWKSTLTIQAPRSLTSFLLQAVRMNWGKNLQWNREIKERNQRNYVENHGETGSWHLSSLCVLWKWKVCSQGSQGTTGLGVAMGLRWLRIQPSFIVMFKEPRLSKWREGWLRDTFMHNTKGRAVLMGPRRVRMSKAPGVWDVCRATSWPPPWELESQDSRIIQAMGW